MLGIAADRFMLAQMRETISAVPSNSGSRSMVVPDRERPGTAHVRMRAGQMPGPQAQVSSGYMPGMGTAPVPAKPPSSSLPGMGGVGAVTVDTSTLLAFTGVAAVLAGIYWFGFRK